MSLKSKPAPYVPRELLFILAAIVPVALLCNTLVHLRDSHPAPGSMTPQAVDARLKPIAHVFAAADEVKVVASAEAAAGTPAAAKN